MSWSIGAAYLRRSAGARSVTSAAMLACSAHRGCAVVSPLAFVSQQAQQQQPEFTAPSRGDKDGAAVARHAAAFAHFATLHAAGDGTRADAHVAHDASTSHGAAPAAAASAHTSAVTRGGGGALCDAAYALHIVDKCGMPAELPTGAPQTLQELEQLCPATSLLRTQVREFAAASRWRALTRVQQAAIAVALEGRDVLCVAPTATGKTFSYVFPCMLRMTLRDSSRDAAAADGTTAEAAATTSTLLRGRDVAALLRDQIASGQVCRYCELNVSTARMCPLTGRPHPAPPPPSVVNALAEEAADEVNGRSARSRALQPVRLDDVAGVGQPQVLVLVPTAQLAVQVAGTFTRLRGPYKTRYLVRASSAEEQQRYLSSLQEADVLVSTPATLLPPLLKHKLSLRRVHTLVLDEVDELVSQALFEPLKMVLAALPRQHARPQRLAYAASLPPPAYEMLRDRLLLPSHRFVLADVRRDTLGYSVLARPPAAALAQGNSSSNEGSDGSSDKAAAAAGDGDGGVAAATAAAVACVPSSLLLASATGVHTHVVWMLGRCEKASKLTWMYTSGLLLRTQRTLVFCNTRHNVAYVYAHLKRTVPDVHVTMLTAHMSHTARQAVLRMFATGLSTCLVCTDVCSRGLDFRGVVYVVHYDMTEEMSLWLHRCGRCGRHGEPGYVYTFFQPENVRLARPLVAHLRQHRQLVPPKLQEYAKQSFVDVLKHSLLQSPTRPVRLSEPLRTTPMLSRGVARYPDYKHDALQRHSRPL